MANSSIANSQFVYRIDGCWPSDAIDVHHVVVQRPLRKGFFLSLFALLIAASGFYLFLLKKQDIWITLFCWSFLVSAFSALFLLLGKHVKKETVIIMPSFGVQLETHYSSGRIAHKFVPIRKILKPVLVECVTPVTCYWSLSLILCGEEGLTLVFKKLRPPLKMLLPMWKALCAVIDNEESADSSTELSASSL